MTNFERYPHIDADYQARDEEQALRDERRQARLNNLWEVYAETGRPSIRPSNPSPLRVKTGCRWNCLRRAHDARRGRRTPMAKKNPNQEG